MPVTPAMAWLAAFGADIGDEVVVETTTDTITGYLSDLILNGVVPEALVLLRRYTALNVTIPWHAVVTVGGSGTGSAPVVDSDPADSLDEGDLDTEDTVVETTVDPDAIDDGDGS